MGLYSVVYVNVLFFVFSLSIYRTSGNVPSKHAGSKNDATIYF